MSNWSWIAIFWLVFSAVLTVGHVLMGNTFGAVLASGMLAISIAWCIERFFYAKM